ncbi:MAG: hypothetical protein ACYTG0_21735 [Planctomycetota bacterium]|jgi:hypothetical protein
MTEPAIQTSSNTATGTRGFADRLGTRFFEWGESGRATGFSEGSGLDPSPVPVYLVQIMPGIRALIDHSAKADTAGMILVDEAESDVAHLLSGEPLSVGALLHDLGHLPVRFDQVVALLHDLGHLPRLYRERTGRSEEELETIDWDVRITAPPPRRADRIVVTFREGSHRPPRIVDDPED